MSPDVFYEKIFLYFCLEEILLTNVKFSPNLAAFRTKLFLIIEVKTFSNRTRREKEFP